jgi:predicted nucleic acid-binding protein
MRRSALLDTGPLGALLDRRDRYHDWAITQFGAVAPPLLTCEAVLSEACFLVRDLTEGPGSVMALLNRGVVQVPFRLDQEGEGVARLLRRYANVPMSLADACLVRMAEQYGSSVLLTLDADFRIYRKHGRRVVPTVMPDDVA